MEEALLKADGANRVIASSKMHSHLMFYHNCEWLSIRNKFPVWTGTMTGYVKPDRTFRDEAERIASIDNNFYIVYEDPKTSIRYLFPVKDGRLDRKDCILAVNHPDFELVTDGNDRIVRADKIDLIEQFPGSNGCYLGDNRYDLPAGRVQKDPPLAKDLRRIEKRVGLAAFGWHLIYTIRKQEVIDLSLSPSTAIGLAVEAPEGTLEKLPCES